jgi:glycosyltransferase involved in cell wall biosynthesis
MRLPYFAAFDSFRFYEACVRALPAFEICHEHNGLFCVGGAMACKRLGMPYVLTVSADPLFERRMLGRPLRGLHGYVAAREAAFTYRLARRILCVSESAKQNLAKSWNLDPEKIVVMANGVDTALFSPDYDPRPARHEWGIGDRPVVAFVGGFQPWHGLDKLIESMVLVRQSVPEALLMLIGDGRARPLVDKAIAENNMQQHVVITGLLPQSKVPSLLSAADVAVLPYPELSAELWFSPLKMYEYMAAGKAIVASNAGQIGDVIKDGETGLLVRPGDVSDLAEAITRLLQDVPLRAQLGRAARQQVLSNHSWDRYVSRLEAVYEQVLTEN